MIWMVFTYFTFALAQAPPPEISEKRKSELRHLVRQDCGSCHGMTLKGGLGKPLTAAALKGKPVGYVKTVILEGAPRSAMPPWKNILKPEEAEYIANVLKNGELE